MCNYLEFYGDRHVAASQDPRPSSPCEMPKPQDTAQIAKLGNVITRTDIRSSVGPFHVLPDYKIRYPEAVIKALGELYAEYNRAFGPLMEANREWPEDYRYCMSPDGSPINFAIQIDMVGLTQEFLDAASSMNADDIREFLRHHIFEIENSLAMYTLLEGGFSRPDFVSFFKGRWRKTLAKLRKRFGKPIALLAVTHEKYNAMRATEFGKTDEMGEKSLSDAEVQELSGFDCFMGPASFRQHLMANDGKCGYLLYARTSDPVTKLKDPRIQVEQPLFADLQMRRIIKEHTLTLNIDDPAWSYWDMRRINDTKAYLPMLGMATRVFSEYDVASYGTTQLRAKPMHGHYGCYGHVTGNFADGKSRRELRHNIRLRGPYIVQPEMDMPRVTNSVDGISYAYIDRIFFAWMGGRPEFLGGFRDMMPLDSIEAQKLRIHGNESAVWAEITS